MERTKSTEDLITLYEGFETERRARETAFEERADLLLEIMKAELRSKTDRIVALEERIKALESRARIAEEQAEMEAERSNMLERTMAQMNQMTADQEYELEWLELQAINCEADKRDCKEKCDAKKNSESKLVNDEDIAKLLQENFPALVEVLSSPLQQLIDERSKKEGPSEK